MDKNYVKEILSTEDGKDDRLIKRGDLIDFDFMEYLCTVKPQKIDKAFYKYNDCPTKGESVYYVQIKCPCCGDIHTESVSKTKFISTIREIENKRIGNRGSSYYTGAELLCKNCEYEKIEKKKREEESRNEEIEKIKKSQTKDYIDWYLDCNRSFKDGLSAAQKIKSIMYSYGERFIDCEKIEDAVKSVDYADFLNTPYWDGVRSYKLKKAHYCCELCGSKGVLNVHHKTYRNHGREHIRIIADRDLIVLCSECHKKFHDKLNNKEVC